MQWQSIVALVIAIPVLLIPVALVWYINAGGIYLALKEARARKTAEKASKDSLAAESAKKQM